MMMRIEGTFSNESMIYIINGAQQKLWINSGGEWTDMSTDILNSMGFVESNMAGIRNQSCRMGWHRRIYLYLPRLWGYAEDLQYRSES